MKKNIALFVLAACLLTGCSGNVKTTPKDDEKIREVTDTGRGGIYTTIEAETAVYSGKYECFEISEPDISRIIAPVGNDGFVVVKGSEPLLGNHAPEDLLSNCEYGVYTLDEGYRGILPKYSVESEKTVSHIITCGSGYVLYLTGTVNSQAVLIENEYYDMHLLKLDDMTDKVISKLPGTTDIQAAVIDGTIYFDTAVSFESSDKVVMAYDISSGELSRECGYAERPFVYKDMLAYFIDGKLASYADPLFDPTKYELDGEELEIIPTGDVIAYTRKTDVDGTYGAVVGYIKDGSPFDIFSLNNIGKTPNISFLNGCAVWNSPEVKLPPVFYSDKYKSLVIVDAEKADYAGFADGGKLYFFGKDDGGYSRVITIDINDI